MSFIVDKYAIYSKIKTGVQYAIDVYTPAFSYSFSSPKKKPKKHHINTLLSMAGTYNRSFNKYIIYG